MTAAEPRERPAGGRLPGRQLTIMVIGRAHQEAAAGLATMAGTTSCVVIAAGTAGRPAGYVDARGGRFRRNRSTAHAVIGALAAASGHGVGSGLLSELQPWAAAHGIHRLDLTVMAHNRRARQLYERMGFAVEGRRRECLLGHGHLVDELYTGKLLPRPDN